MRLFFTPSVSEKQQKPKRLWIEELEPRTLLSTFDFDFGPIGAPVAPGYTAIAPVLYAKSQGYGWASLAGLGAQDEHTGRALTTDFHYGKDATFLVDLPNGTYDVTPTLGDAQVRHMVAIWAQGRQVATNVTTAAGQYVHPSYRVQVSNGQLALRVAGFGGTTATFALDGLDVNVGTGVFEHMNWNQMTTHSTANIQNPNVAGAEIHLPWSMLEPSKGTFDYRFLDSFLASWGAAGKKVTLSVKTSPDGAEVNPYAGSSTPQWVYAEGAKSVTVNQGGVAQQIPLLWDPIFLNEYQTFIQQFAARYDGNPAIEYIIVGPGVFNSTRAIYPGNIDILRQAGYTDKLWFQTNMQVMGWYQSGFQMTHLSLGMAPFISDSVKPDPQYNQFTLARLAAQQGMYLDYHNLRGNSDWTNSAYPQFFASLGTSTKITLGMDNPTSTSAQMRQIYGDPLSCVANAFGGVNGQPPINTYYLEIYCDDVSAGTPGTSAFQQPYADSLALAMTDWAKWALTW
jgi:hypothetical protein